MEGTVGAFLRVAEGPDKVVKVGVFAVTDEEMGREDLGRESLFLLRLLFVAASSPSYSFRVF